MAVLNTIVQIMPIWKYSFDRFPRSTCDLHLYNHESDFDFRHGFTDRFHISLRCRIACIINQMNRLGLII